MQGPTHHYQFWSAEERQIDARNPFRNIREVPYERALKLLATRRLRIYMLEYPLGSFDGSAVSLSNLKIY